MAVVDELTVDEAARRLGVKPATLYAYVSRGVLDRRRGPDGRTSRFDAADIDALARRGRPRRSSRTTGLDIEIDTSLTAIQPDRVRYRGHDAARLARRRTFEEVAELLWTGELGTVDEPWPVVELDVGSGGSMIDVLARAVQAAAITDDHRRENDIARAGRRMVSAMVHGLPEPGDGRVSRLHLPEREPLRDTIAGRLWGRLAPTRPPAGAVATLNAALVLLADHELAASTLAVRVAASTRADPYAAVSAGLATASGPLHGAASRLTRRMLERAATSSGESALADAQQRYGTLPGFGHPLYERGDPRARALLELMHETWSGSRQLAQVDALVAAARRRGEAANVDLALAALSHVAGMPVDAGQTIFAIARTAGWLAHAAEEYGEAPLRFRPRARFRDP